MRPLIAEASVSASQRSTAGSSVSEAMVCWGAPPAATWAPAWMRRRLRPFDHDAGPAARIGHDEVLGRVVADVDEAVALPRRAPARPSRSSGVRLGERAAAERMRVDDLAEVRRDAERGHLLGLHVVRAVGDQPELGLGSEMAERPAGVVEQRQLRLVVAVGLEQAGQVLRACARAASRQARC